MPRFAGSPRCGRRRGAEAAHRCQLQPAAAVDRYL